MPPNEINERVRKLKETLETVCAEIVALQGKDVMIEFGIENGKLIRFVAFTRNPIKFEH